MMARLLSRLTPRAPFRAAPLLFPKARAFSAAKSLPGKEKSSVMFTLTDCPGALNRALKTFNDYNVNMTRIESRPGKRSLDIEFYVDFLGSIKDKNVENMMVQLKLESKTVTVLNSQTVPWFPRKIREVDLLAQDVLSGGAELEADHPGFHDETYLKRRRELAAIADACSAAGGVIPRVEYTPEEVGVWSEVYGRLVPLYEAHACAEFNRLMPLLRENCGYRVDNIPQLQDISEFLLECTGFRLRPVSGLLSSRNFLYGLAFRVFFCTQYIRHHSKPLYTPEPDICHELMGHAPLFADQAFADFSQEIGLASIGATDEQITKLARCYWFSVEFGLCQQGGERKAYGAGLLSSFGEMEYAMSDEPEILPWDPFVAGETDFPITSYQPKYFMASSFEDAKERMSRFGDSFARKFNVRYNPYTQSLEVDSNVQIQAHPSVKTP